MQQPLNKRVFLLLGTNLGDRHTNLLVAKQQLEITAGKIICESGIYQTAAWGKTDQPEFFNQVTEVLTERTPHELLEAVLTIEKQMGRQREIKWGPRLIDIDILFYDDIVIKTEKLEVPHPALHKRRFTLAPMAEIAPDFVHPILRKPISVLLSECEDPLSVERLQL